jgi:hypothetical protein
MYSWFNKQLKLGLSEPVVEEDYHRLTRDQLTVWDEEHPKPPGGPEFERSLLRWITDDAARQLQHASDSPGSFRELVAPAVELGRKKRSRPRWLYRIRRVAA